MYKGKSIKIDKYTEQLYLFMLLMMMIIITMKMIILFMQTQNKMVKRMNTRNKKNENKPSECVFVED
jgi:hypothetical protein